MIFKNTTALDDRRLRDAFDRAVAPGPVASLDVRVRYSRGSDFSGACHYTSNRLYVNLGRHLRYPYRMDTYLARAVSSKGAWFKPLYGIELVDGYQVVLFVLLHEYYHWLIKRARRNTRQKESMCDRYAARILVEQYGAVIRDPGGRLVPRESWDFQDLDRFVAAAFWPRRRRRPPKGPLNTATPVRPGEQLLLWGT